MVATYCSIMTGDGHHRSAIVAIVVLVIGPDVCAFCMWVEACSSNVGNCVPSSDCIDLNGLISPPLETTGSFLIITNVQGRIKVV